MSDNFISQPSDGWAPDASAGEGAIMENESDNALSSLHHQIRHMPDPRVPADFVSSVMKGIHPIKRPWWYRMKKWAKAPISITPLQIAPAAGAFVAVCLIFTIYLGQGENRTGLLEAQSQASAAAAAVTLTLNRPDAKSVSLVGSFNGWHGGDCAMHRNETAWTITLHIPKGRYEYAFLVDGEEIVPDPGARIYQDDGFGKKNAVLIVGNPDEKSI